MKYTVLCKGPKLEIRSFEFSTLEKAELQCAQIMHENNGHGNGYYSDVILAKSSYVAYSVHDTPILDIAGIIHAFVRGKERWHVSFFYGFEI